MPVGASWEGAAHARFDGLYAEWSRSAEVLQQALAGISQLLQQAGHAYDETEQRVAGSFAG
jgi:WXG100 family type VII secretion target